MNRRFIFRLFSNFFYFVMLRTLLLFKFFPSALSPIKMISYTLILMKWLQKVYCIDYDLMDKENLLNRLLLGRQGLILRFSSPFHILSCISLVLRL